MSLWLFGRRENGKRSIYSVTVAYGLITVLLVCIILILMMIFSNGV